MSAQGGNAATEPGFTAETGWLKIEDRLYVNVDDLINVLREGGWIEVAEDFERIAEEERRVHA